MAPLQGFHRAIAAELPAGREAKAWARGLDRDAMTRPPACTGAAHVMPPVTAGTAAVVVTGRHSWAPRARAAAMTNGRRRMGVSMIGPGGEG